MENKIELSTEQSAGLDKVLAWSKTAGRGDIFRIFGYAGTGKSTIVEQLAERIGRVNVIFTAFTGKACEVLTRKGCEARTIHSLIYGINAIGRAEIDKLKESLKELPEDSKEFKTVEVKLKGLIKRAMEPQFSIRENAGSIISSANSFIIVDECSMIDEKVGEDLVAIGLPLIVMGDPGQLPPPKGMGYFNPPNIEPDVMLTQIHRQVAHSPILIAATYVRQGQRERLSSIDGGEAFRYIRRAKLTVEEVNNADLIIVGTNKTRLSYNARIRELRGLSGWPKKGEQLICLKNSVPFGYQNGGLFELMADAVYVKDMDKIKLKVKNLNSGLVNECYAWAFHFRNELPSKPWWEYEGAEEFYFGYAITCHKAQGSQAAKVVVIDESKAFRLDADKWLYTALTRASESVTVAY